MTVEEKKHVEAFVHGLTVATITQPSKRDRQKAPGPSDLAGKCDLCVARKIANSLSLGSYVESGFSLKAWLGTAVHEKMERDLPKIFFGAHQEIEVSIGDIPDVGPVVGHIDLFLPEKRALVDWKTTDMKKLVDYKKDAGPGAYTQHLTFEEREELERLKVLDKVGMLSPSDVGRMILLMASSEKHSGGVPLEYMGQTMLYLYGLLMAGYDVEYAVISFIPRDSNYVSDIWVTSCKYRPDVAEGVIKRASHLAGLVRSGKIGSLKPHPQCWDCSIKPRLAR